MTIRNSLPALATLGLLGGCSGHSGSSTDPVDPAVAKSSLKRAAPTISDSDLSSAATSERELGVDIYKQLGDTSPNLFFSPHSIIEALMMTYDGARTETAMQMHDVLHLSLSDDAENAAMNGLDLALTSRGQGQPGTNGQPFKLAVANALWGQTGTTFEQPFLDSLATNYGAGMSLVDFVHATEASRTEINDWVAQQTENKILNLLAPGTITVDTRLVLTNAVYFDASWAEPFDKSATTNEPFTRVDGSTVSVPTMTNVSTSYTAYQGSGVTAVAIPYAGNQLSMVVVLPDDLASFEAGLTSTSLDSVIAGLGSYTVTLHMPSWSVTNSNSLKTVLSGLGMTDAFDHADFSGIDGGTDLVISDVIHKAFVDVDESGTEAAAATAVVVSTDGVAHAAPPPIEVTLDKPFLYLIRDNATGAVVFMGRLGDPASP